MTRMLVVVSTTLSPLSTESPLPTDGQPGWWRCADPVLCERDREGAGVTHDCPGRVRAEPTPGYGWVPDGPFPFTVAVWQEVCELEVEEVQHSGPCKHFVGAVVATVEVTGRGHDATSVDHYCIATDGETAVAGWHTPTETVTRLDVPIPMERPSLTPTAFGPTVIRSTSPLTERSEPASWWWADIDIETAASGG